MAKFTLLVITMGALLIGCSKKETSTTGVKAAELNTTNETKTDPKDLKTLKFGLASNTDVLSGIFGIAQSKGYLDEELAGVGYKIEILGFAQAGPAVNEAFVSEDIDIANYGDLPAVVLKSKGIGVSVVGISDTSANLSIVVPKDSDIQSVKDLEGKKVFVAIGTVIEQYWDRVVTEYGLDESKIEIINDPANALSSFISGNGDALVHVDINNAKVDAQYPVRYIDSTKATHPEWGYQGVIVARDEFAKEHPEVVTALFKAYLRAYDDAVADSELFYNSIVQDGITYDLVKSVYGDIDISNGDGDLAQENIDKLEELNSFLYDSQLTTESVDVNSFINTTFYEEAKKALGK
jgi:sulfonate transport system substrate-binding protein